MLKGKIMIIRKLSSNDIVSFSDTLQILIGQCLETIDTTLQIDKICAEKVESLIDYISKGLAYVYGAFESNNMVGFIWGYPVQTTLTTYFHIAYLSVLPIAQNNGVAYKLIEKIENDASNLSLDTINLSVSSANKRAIGFYLRNGFECSNLVLKKHIEADE